tara:strand:- start:58138 stop:58497 length:360 start_codon:yes stop_codon:yes gene_type:complete
MTTTLRSCLSVLCGSLLLSGCTKSPQSIQPAQVAPSIYADRDCAWLDAEARQVSDKLAAASQQQQRAHDNERDGFLLSGWPISTLSGDDIAPQIARLKGEQQAVQRARERNGCEIAPPG